MEPNNIWIAVAITFGFALILTYFINRKPKPKGPMATRREDD